VFERHADRLLASASGDRGTGSGSTTPADPEGGSDGSLKVGLNWHPNALHAPLYAGQAHGHYGGLDVAFEAHTGSAAALDALIDGDADVALVGAATLVSRDEAGVVPVALLYERAMAVLYTTREAFGGPFERVQQLRGRRVGMSTGSETARLARLLLSQVGSLSEVEIVDLDGEERAALRSGRVDAVTGQVPDPERLDTAEETVYVLPVAKQFPLYGPALVTTEGTLDARSGALRALLVGTMCGWADAAECPGDAADCVPRIGGDERDRDTVANALAEFGFDDGHGWGCHDEAGWERLGTALAQVDGDA
jgi:ABC-type nitrate/sulfonate/bicarbonate transport system substrate-binding protein